MNPSDQRRFLFARVRASQGGGWQALLPRIDAALAGWSSAVTLGRFMGLFGIDNQSLLLLVSLPAGADAAGGLRERLPAGVELVDALAMRATVRPPDDRPLTRPGIHVFRFWEGVRDGDCATVAQLSARAWETWERDDAYTSEPMGLFRYDQPGAPEGRMLLLTWYDNLTSWERSRTPHPEAAANFQRRLALSRSAIAYATRLIA